MNTADLTHVAALADSLERRGIDECDAFLLAGKILTKTPCLGELKDALRAAGYKRGIGRAVLKIWREAKAIAA